MVNNHVTKKVWSSVILFLLVGCLVVFSVVLVFNTIEKNQEFESILSGYTGGNTDIVVLKQESAEAVRIQEELEGWLLSPKDTVDLVEYVEVISKQVGLEPSIDQLNTKDLGNGSDNQNVSVLELILQLDGTFEETQKFLELMENIPYQSYIGQVQLRGGGENGWNIKIQAIVFTNPN